jgi:hypothetical protein
MRFNRRRLTLTTSSIGEFAPVQSSTHQCLASAMGHPSEEGLEEYRFGRLIKLHRQTVADHLAQCDSCKCVMENLDQFIFRLSQVL